MIAQARLIAYGLALAAIAGVAWLVLGWREDAQKLPSVRQELEQARADFEAYRAESQRQYRIAQEVSNGYHQELARLRAERRPAPVVRVCVAPDVPAAPSDAESAPRPDAAGPGGGLVQEAPGRDIGPELYALADDADRCAAQLRGLQSWVRSVTPPGR